MKTRLALSVLGFFALAYLSSVPSVPPHGRKRLEIANRLGESYRLRKSRPLTVRFPAK